MAGKKTSSLKKPALEQLLARREMFVSFVARRVGSRSVAEDIVQAAFVRGFERGDRLRDQESVVAWFYRILRNAIVDYFRSSLSQNRALEALAAEIQRTPNESAELKREICACIGGLLEELKPEYKQAIQISEINEQPLSDLASQAGISVSNAAVRVHRARQSLLKQVKETCGACAEHQCVNCNCRR